LTIFLFFVEHNIQNHQSCHGNIFGVRSFERPVGT
jgi:hypothetical protein